MTFRRPILPTGPGAKTDDRIADAELAEIIAESVPHWSYRTNNGTGNRWSWTSPAGTWNAVITAADAVNPPPRGMATLSAWLDLDGIGKYPRIYVRATRREVDAALRFLVALGAIDRHPDDPVAADEAR